MVILPELYATTETWGATRLADRRFNSEPVIIAGDLRSLEKMLELRIPGKSSQEKGL
jgi:hypothetical protein